jgi:hypothetical protein
VVLSRLRRRPRTPAPAVELTGNGHALFFEYATLLYDALDKGADRGQAKEFALIRLLRRHGWQP